MRKGLLWAGFGVLVAGVTFYGVQQYRMIQKLCYKISNFRITGVSPMSVAVDLTVVNKDRFVAKITRIKLNLFIDGKYITTIVNDRGFDIQPHNEATTPLNMSFKLKEALKGIGSAFWKNKKIDLRGYIVVKKFGLPIMIKVNQTFYLSSVSGGGKKESC